MDNPNGARWCGYCEHSLETCVCPPWMPNTGTDEQRKARGERQESLRKKMDECEDDTEMEADDDAGE